MLEYIILIFYNHSKAFKGAFTVDHKLWVQHAVHILRMKKAISLFSFFFYLPAILSGLFLLSFASSAFSSAFEDIGVGARGRGMGGAFRAVVDDSSAIYWNPASLGKVNKREFSAFYQDLYGLGLLNYSFIGYTYPRIGNGTIGFGWARMGTSGSVSVMNYAENTFMFSYGHKFTKLFSAGATIKYYSVLYDYKASGVGVDIAGNYVLIKDKLSTALVLYNINKPQIYWETKAVDTLPSKIYLSAAYKANENHIFSLEADTNMEGKTHPSAGWEGCFINRLLTFRAGASELDGQLNPAAGFSIGYRKLRFDYTLEQHYSLGYSSLVNVTIGM